MDLTIRKAIAGANALQTAQAGGGLIAAQPTVQVNPAASPVFNGVSKQPIPGVLARPGVTLAFTLDNTSGTSLKKFKIGDPTGNGASIIFPGVTFVDPVLNNQDYDGWLKSLYAAAYSYQQVNYQTSSSATQFSQDFFIANFNIADGSNLGTSNIGPNIGATARSTDQNTLIKTFNTGDYVNVAGTQGAIIFDIDSFLTLDVLAGEKVVLYLQPLAVSK